MGKITIILIIILVIALAGLGWVLFMPSTTQNTAQNPPDSGILSDQEINQDSQASDQAVDKDLQDTQQSIDQDMQSIDKGLE